MQHETEQTRLRDTRLKQKEAENALHDAKLGTRHLLARKEQAQQVIDRAARIQEREARKRGVMPSPWDNSPAKEADGPELG